MHTQVKEQAQQDIRPVGREWEIFLPAVVGEGEELRDFRDTGSALRQAETIIRAQEERIRVLEAMALCDELTGVANRRGFSVAFERELSLARRDQAQGGVLAMIDLDGFKAINDKWGHQAGDAYLLAVADTLKDCVRSSDIVARLGGDEFAILLTHMDEKAGMKRLMKIEQIFNHRSMLWNGRRVMLRASFGIAAYAGGDSVESVVQAADVKLYAHKARNKKLVAAALRSNAQ